MGWGGVGWGGVGWGGVGWGGVGWGGVGWVGWVGGVGWGGVGWGGVIATSSENFSITLAKVTTPEISVHRHTLRGDTWG